MTNFSLPAIYLIVVSDIRWNIRRMKIHLREEIMFPVSQEGMNGRK